MGAPTCIRVHACKCVHEYVHGRAHARVHSVRACTRAHSLGTGACAAGRRRAARSLRPWTACRGKLALPCECSQAYVQRACLLGEGACCGLAPSAAAVGCQLGACMCRKGGGRRCPVWKGQECDNKSVRGRGIAVRKVCDSNKVRGQGCRRTESSVCDRNEV
eukprot:366404-Chlamydomonas_euryale.AAC.4